MFNGFSILGNGCSQHGSCNVRRFIFIAGIYVDLVSVVFIHGCSPAMTITIRWVYSLSKHCSLYAYPSILFIQYSFRGKARYKTPFRLPAVG